MLTITEFWANPPLIHKILRIAPTDHFFSFTYTPRALHHSTFHMMMMIPNEPQTHWNASNIRNTTQPLYYMTLKVTTAPSNSQYSAADDTQPTNQPAQTPKHRWK